MNTQPIPSLFDYQPTIDRRNESWHSLQPKMLNSQLGKIIEYLRIHPNQTSRQIAAGTGIERTSVCRTLGTKKNKKYFDVTGERQDPITGKRVTVYKLATTRVPE